MMALLLAACSSGTGTAGGAGGAPTDDRWAPTTTPYDPTCASGCEVIEQGDFGHIGELTLLVNPNVDDPVAQWGDCIDSFRLCIEKGTDARACSERSDCPESCRADYQDRIDGVNELEAQLEAFQAVFIDVGAPCLPPIDEEAR
jgi:hypothetical protein